MPLANVIIIQIFDLIFQLGFFKKVVLLDLFWLKTFETSFNWSQVTWSNS